MSSRIRLVGGAQNLTFFDPERWLIESRLEAKLGIALGERGDGDVERGLGATDR